MGCSCSTQAGLWVQIQGLPTLIFIGKDKSKPALRTEGLLEQNTIKEIITTELL